MATTWTREDELFRLNVTQLAATAPVPPEEETRLLRQMTTGQKAYRRLNRTSSLDEKEKAQLGREVAAGAKARERLIQANGRLVISIARNYLGHGLSLAELCQEGVLGLIRAIDKFDLRKGVRLSTYASYWIRQSVGRAVAVQTRLIRLPIHRVDQLSRVRRVTGELTQTLGRTPHLEEIANHLEEPVEKIEDLLEFSHPVRSLDEPVGDDELTTFGDFIENDVAQGLDEQVDKGLLEQAVREALASLDARESRIVELRYGLRDGKMLTLQDVAERFGLTRERIRQIEKEAIQKLRRGETFKYLNTFVS
ncbi:MAG TPA: sigma-70 family RNA polymerase sigma factor [Anaerolineae bacterium]|nr:sigma-70 family RNA polymerase sigma factor [Anaerolineae bacterium]